MAEERTVEPDWNGRDFGQVTVAELSAAAARFGAELHIEFKKPAPLPGPKKGRVRA